MAGHDDHHDILDTLADALDGGRRAILVVIDVSANGSTCLNMRTTQVSALDLHETALFLIERAIRQAANLADGSGTTILPHLLAAARSLQAGSAAVGFEVAPTVVGRG